MPRRKTYSFRPDGDLEKRLLDGLEATGAQAQDILEACVQQSLELIVRNMIEERRRDEAAWLKEKPVIIKIDTATGDAWRLHLLNNNGKSLDSWKAISNTATKL